MTKLHIYGSVEEVHLHNNLKDGWQANCSVVNNTSFPISLSGVGIDSTIVNPGDQYSWSSQQVNNTIAININAIPMQGNLSFGPEAGVYVDRGWMQNQTIQMVAVANGKSFVQNSNGGEELLQWNEFEQGGDISLTFSNI